MSSTEQKIEEASKLVAAGQTVKAACEQVGVHFSTYYIHKRKSIVGKKVRKPYTRKKIVLTELPVASGARLEIRLDGKDITQAFLSKFMGVL